MAALFDCFCGWLLCFVAVGLMSNSPSSPQDCRRWTMKVPPWDKRGFAPSNKNKRHVPGSLFTPHLGIPWGIAGPTGLATLRA
jgi:hypothetical protein